MLMEPWERKYLILRDYMKVLELLAERRTGSRGPARVVHNPLPQF